MVYGIFCAISGRAKAEHGVLVCRPPWILVSSGRADMGCQVSGVSRADIARVAGRQEAEGRLCLAGDRVSQGQASRLPASACCHERSARREWSPSETRTTIVNSCRSPRWRTGWKANDFISPEEEMARYSLCSLASLALTTVSLRRI